MDQIVYITEIKNEGFLALSFNRPRFCLSGKTEEEAMDKAKDAFSYYSSYSSLDQIVSQIKVLKWKS